MSVERAKRVLRHPIVEAFVLAALWLLIVMYGAPDPVALYGRF